MSKTTSSHDLFLKAVQEYFIDYATYGNSVPARTKAAAKRAEKWFTDELQATKADTYYLSAFTRYDSPHRITRPSRMNPDPVRIPIDYFGIVV